MKKSRRHLSSSEFSEEDRHAHKYSKRAGRDCNKRYLTDDFISRARDSSSEARGRMSRRHADDFDSNIDVLSLKHRASQRSSRRKRDDFVSRQLRDIERAQRGATRPASSSSSQEIHIHYHSNPFSSCHDSRSLSSAEAASDGSATYRSKAQGVSASELTKELKGLTMSWISKREASLSRKRSSHRSKHGHEKRAKHGKKKTDAFLAPLEQRWVCYECGKVRSDKIQERHPLTGGQKMQPNWCGQCRISHELKGRPLDWHGQRHYCWGCGIVRSEKYHHENPIPDGETSEPNYCKPCRESSPGFERNLREASDVGSEVSVRDKAFQRQVHDAELSDIHEDEDEEGDVIMSNGASGKENEDPNKAAKIKKATSFLLKNRAFKTKTSSDTSSDGSIPIKMLKDMHLEADKALSLGDQVGGGGARLSVGSYKPASVESVSCESSSSHAGTKYTYGETTGNVAPAHGDIGCEIRGLGTSIDAHSGKQDDTSPTILAFPHQHTSSPSKKVHWSDNDSRPATIESNRSAISSILRSESSVTSAGSLRRPRRNPAETSSGSPLEKDGVSNENIGDSLRRESMRSERPPQSSGIAGGGGQGLPPSQGTFGQNRSSGCDVTDSYAHGQTLSGFGVPPTPPQEEYGPYAYGDHACQRKPSYWDSLHDQTSVQDVPNFSRPYQSPQKYHPDASRHAYDGSGYGTRPDYFDHSHNGFDSAAHFSDKDGRRDFSGNSYDEPTTGRAYGYSSYQDGYNTEDPFLYTSPRHDNSSHRANRDAYMYAPQCESNDGCPAQPVFEANEFPGHVSPEASHPFDFSGFGRDQDKRVNDDFYSHVPDEEEVRRYTRNFMSQPEAQKTPPAQPQWRLYDDGDAEEHHTDRGYEWRGNGQTTIHRPNSGNSTSSGNRVTILSIREITSDDDLSTPLTVADDYDAAMNSICAT